MKSSADSMCLSMYIHARGYWVMVAIRKERMKERGVGLMVLISGYHVPEFMCKWHVTMWNCMLICYYLIEKCLLGGWIQRECLGVYTGYLSVCWAVGSVF